MKSEDLAALYSLYEECSASAGLTEEGLWSLLIKKVSEAAGCEAATYFEADESKKTLTFRQSIGPVGGDIIGVSFAYQGIAGWCAENRKPIMVADTDADGRFTAKVDRMTGFKTRSVLAVPAIAGGRLLGVAEFINSAGGAFTETDMKFAALISGCVAREVLILRLEDSARRLTMKVDATIENLSGGFIGADQGGAITFFNPKAREILGTGRDLVGMDIGSLAKICPELASALEDALKQGKTARRREFRLNAAGSARLIGYSSICIKNADGAAAGAGVIFQDITNI